MTNYEKYQAYLHDCCSPRNFLRWNYLFSISSILARKVWVGEESKIFANLYVIFIGPPGIGKSWPANLTREELSKIIELKADPKPREIPLLNLAPESLTVERMYELMADCVDNIQYCDNPPKFYIHSSMTFYHTEELTTLFKKNQDDLVDFFVQGWNGGSFKRETKSSGKCNIQNMCINLCSCTTTKKLGDCMSKMLITEGFTSRTIFVYADKPYHRVPIFKPTPDAIAGFKEVKAHWREVGKLFGEVKLAEGVVDWLHNWIKTKMDNHLNKAKSLEEYYVRKYHLLIKLALACHFSEETTMLLSIKDFETAECVLELAEVDMHKALKGIGINPLHRLAEEIKTYLEKNGATTYKKLLAEFFDGGNHEDIQKAIQHKEIVGEILGFTDDNTGLPSYKVVYDSSDTKGVNGKEHHG